MKMILNHFYLKHLLLLRTVIVNESQATLKWGFRVQEIKPYNLLQSLGALSFFGL
jgi:hypothetical protein